MTFTRAAVAAMTPEVIIPFRARPFLTRPLRPLSRRRKSIWAGPMCGAGQVLPLPSTVPVLSAGSIQERMAEAGITNVGVYMRKMALNGYILHVDLAPVRELVSLQRRCANNLNQVAVHANTFGVYPEEIAGLQRDYEKLWGQVSDVLTELSALVEK